MTSLCPYSAYKPSGIEWLGDIPRHWTVKKLKSMSRMKSGEGITSFGIEGEGTFPVYGGNGIRGYAESFTHDGDYILVGRQGALCGNVHRVSGKFWASEHAIVVTPFSWVNVDWFGSVLRVMDLNQYSISAAQPGLAVERVVQLAIPAPPLPEQQAIADFLDIADARISRYIAAKRRMITLLEEQKQAIINQAVTRGLDPNVPLKPSGVDWLGDIPAHWEVKRAKVAYREIDQRSTSGEEESLSVSHLTGVTPRSQKTITMFKAESYIGHKLCQAGDVVVNTMWAWMGALGVSEFVGLISPSYAVYRCRTPRMLVPKFADHLLRTRIYVDEINRRSTGIHSSRLRLYPDQFLNLPLLLPPLVEQKKIVDSISEQTVSLASFGDRARREIELIQEYRTRLISDVVTGKLDVRGVELPALEHPS